MRHRHVNLRVIMCGVFDSPRPMATSARHGHVNLRLIMCRVFESIKCEDLCGPHVGPLSTVLDVFEKTCMHCRGKVQCDYAV